MNIITADQVQKGDKIKVTETIQEGECRKVTHTYEGVAAKQNGIVWRTEDGGNLWVHETGTVIELLDRPIPKIVLPNSAGAVVKYVRSGLGRNGTRFAVLNGKDFWVVYDENGDRVDGRSTVQLSDMIARNGWAHEVIVGSVK